MLGREKFLMVIKKYFRTAGNSVKLMLKNPVLYVPDIIYYAATAVLAYLFLYLNNLTAIFSGTDLFVSRIREVASASNLLYKLLFTFGAFVLVNFIVGLGTISFRYVLIKQLIENRKTEFFKAHKIIGRYVLDLFFLKFLLLLIYLLPLAFFAAIALLYNSLVLPMIIFAVLSLIILRFVFLFAYPALFLKGGRGSARTISLSIKYFSSRTGHVLITGIFILIVNFIINIISKNIAEGYAGFSLLGFNYATAIGVVFLALVNISMIIWGAVFLFKNY